jgi:hypothetical protein
MSARYSRTAVTLILGALAAGPASAEVMKGQWATHRQNEGPAITFSNPATHVIFVYALCQGGGVKLTTMVPANGGYSAARQLLGQTVPITFTSGALRFSYPGAVYDDGEMIAADIAATLDDALFKVLATAKSVRLASPSAAIDIPLRGAGPALARWTAECGGGAPSVAAHAEPHPAILARNSGGGESASAGLPADLQAWRDGSFEDCRTDGGKASVTPNYIRSADFNGDGKPDYVVHESELTCQGALNRNCGSLGCSLEAFVSSGGGYRRGGLSQLNAYEVKIDDKARPPRLVMVMREGAAVYRWQGNRFVRAK